MILAPTYTSSKLSRDTESFSGLGNQMSAFIPLEHGRDSSETSSWNWDSHVHSCQRWGWFPTQHETSRCMFCDTPSLNSCWAAACQSGLSDVEGGVQLLSLEDQTHNNQMQWRLSQQQSGLWQSSWTIPCKDPSSPLHICNSIAKGLDFWWFIMLWLTWTRVPCDLSELCVSQPYIGYMRLHFLLT